MSSFQRYVSSSENAGERQWRTFFYGQDTWKITSKFTLNYGLRWEIYFPQTVTGKDQGGWLDVNTGEMLVAGENGVGLNGNVQNSFKNLAPRLGVAYQVNSKTVVRLGYGRSFDVGEFGSIFGHSVTQNLPVLGTQSMQPSNSWESVFNLAQGPPMVDPATVLDSQPKGPTGNPLYPNGFRAWVYPAKMTLPTVDAWNATVQRQITNTFSLEAAYVGNKGTHLGVGEGPYYDLNSPTLTGFGTLSTDERRPYFAKYGWNVPMLCFCNEGNDRYDALQVKAEKRFTSGFSILSHYTYSRSANNDSPDFLYNPQLYYGRPNWQRNNVFVFTGIWDLPFGKSRKFLGDVPTPVNYIVGGWQLSGAGTWMSGLGFSPSYQECGNDNDIGVCRPILVGDPSVSNQNPNNWFAVSPAALANPGDTSGPWQRPQTGTLGTTARNFLTGPGWFDADVSIQKTFPIRETFQAQFRAEIYNIFNDENLANPNGCVDCGNGNVITSLANNAFRRKMQFGIMFQF